MAISSNPMAQHPPTPHSRSMTLYVISVGAMPSERIICTRFSARFT